jgi:(1->4)-alpha-D-glucan 1-alpha-D-glucosylmutase
MLRIPAATYRVQFNSGFTFQDARRIVPYLAELGITDLYASPILKARKGSAHGYDVVDANSLNPELGTEDDFNALHHDLQQHRLGLLLDIVPNHMAASPENAWWMSVLENGPHSRFLHYFDIDWSPVTAQGRTTTKVLLPILGRPYGEAVESQEIKLGYDNDGFFFSYHDHRLPLAPESYRTVLHQCADSLPSEGVGMELRELVGGEATVPNSKFLKETISRLHQTDERFRGTLQRTIEKINGDASAPDSVNALDALLDEQWYRLAYWRIASEKINYRRFFDVTDLIGVRVENPEVFEASNRRTLELIAEGKVTGLRIDHIDGLFDPIGHMRKLQLRLATAGGETAGAPLSFYVVVEKVLEYDETLPEEFPVSGTTGYDFLDSVSALFVDPAGLEKLTTFYRDFTGLTDSFEELVYQSKKQVISELFSGEMRGLGKQLSGLAMLDRNARDFAPSELLAALTEITACMPVYRTYVRDTEASEEDRRFITEAMQCARQRASGTLDPRLLTFLERVLLVDLPPYTAGERDNWLAFVMRWQQFTGRVMAKGVEDTAFYNDNRLVSLNEVGGDPGRDGHFDALEEFHRRSERIARDWPDTLNATSTHDTKRSEDVRARISVLSEISEDWMREVRQWSAANANAREHGAPDPNMELLIYQTLIGMWPLDEEERDTVEERLRHYLEKAAREAKTYTSWIDPNTVYEHGVQKFASAILKNAAFCQPFLALQKRVAFYGFLNALSQSVLKITSPGVPDFYQGTELWDLSLVDPDNRRPVDYERRASTLKELKASDARGSLDVSAMLRRWADGGAKLFVTWKTLELRARRAQTFGRGGYQPLRVSPNVVAFRRGEDVIVAVPRLTTKLGEAGQLPVGGVWGAGALAGAGGRWRNIFTGEELEGDSLPLAAVFARFPVAVLERIN